MDPLYAVRVKGADLPVSIDYVDPFALTAGYYLEELKPAALPGDRYFGSSLEVSSVYLVLVCYYH